MDGLRVTYRLAWIGWLIAGCWSAAVTWGIGPAEDQFTVAAGHYARRDWELAAAEWREFLADYPQHRLVPAAQYYLAESLTQLGKYQQVAETLKRLVAEHPSSLYAAKAAFRQGEADYMLQRYDTALRRLEAYLKATPNDRHVPHALLYVARIEQHHEHFERAVEVYRRLLAEHPDHRLADDARLQLARIMESQGRMEAAEGFLRFVVQHGRPETAARARLALLRLAAARKAWDEVIRQGRPLIDDADRSRSAAARLLVAQGLAARRAWPEVLDTLKPLLAGERLDRFGAKAALLAADAHRFQGAFKQAEKVLHRALQSVSTTASDGPRASERAVTVALQRKQIEVFAAQGATDRAIDVGKRLLKRSDLSPEERTAVVRRQLKLLAAAGRYQAIRKLVETSTELKQIAHDRWSVYYAALGLVASGAPDAALQWLDRVAPASTDAESAGVEPTNEQLERALLEVRLRALVQLDRIAESVDVLRTWRKRLDDDAPTDQAERDRLTEATLHVAQQAARRDRPKLARRLFEELLQAESPPTRAAAVSGIAWLALDAGDTAEAAQWFHRLLRKHPRSPLASVAAYRRGAALEELGQWNAALAMYELVIQDYPDSSEAPHALLAAAGVHRRLHQYHDASSKLERLLEGYPDFAHRDAALYRLGWSRYREGRTEDAVEAFRRLRSSYPQSPYRADATYRLARWLVERGDLSAARERLEELAATPLDKQLAPHVWLLEMQLHVRAAEWEQVGEAAEKIEQSAGTGALAAQAAFWKAEADFRRQRWSAAWDGFVTAYRLRNELPASLQELTRLRQCQIRAHEERWAEGLKLADELLASGRPGRASEVHYVRGRCLVGLGRLAAARTALERAIDADRPQRTETAAMAAWMVGETWFMERRYEEAIRAYLRVDALYPQARWRAAGLLQAGKCYELLGRWSRAESMYRRIVDEFSTTEHVQEARRRMGVARQRAAAAR